MGEISVNALIVGSPEELNENILKMKQDAKEWTEGAQRSDFNMGSENVKEGEFQCFKCKSRKIWNVQRQMRCADEPMTTFFYCTECEFRWKMG
jgi:DNA-directed RNA polymerase subunit M/transcription elongation factor TFIIS